MNMYYLLRNFFRGLQQLEPTITTESIAYFVQDDVAIAQNRNSRQNLNQLDETYAQSSSSLSDQNSQYQRQTNMQRVNQQRTIKLKTYNKMLQIQDKSSQQLSNDEIYLNPQNLIKSHKQFSDGLSSQNETLSNETTQNRFINHVRHNCNSYKGIGRTLSYDFVNQALKNQQEIIFLSDKTRKYKQSSSQEQIQISKKINQEEDISQFNLGDQLVNSYYQTKKGKHSDNDSPQDDYIAIKHLYQQNRRQNRQSFLNFKIF